MKIHALAELFPLIEGKEFEALVESIRQNGVLEPIWLDKEGAILDGRNRQRASEIAGKTPEYLTYEGDNALQFVLDKNLHRRHLNESQRAMVAARLATMEKGTNQHAQICAPSQNQAAEMLNVSRRMVQDARKVHETGTPETIRAVESGELPIHRVMTASKREERFQEITKTCEGTPAMPNKKYAVVYADPPWRYEHIKTESRAIENNYPTMSLEDICALPIAKIGNTPSILFLWATTPKLEEALQVINAWGYKYRTSMVWAKDRIGMGYWVRNQHELLLICTKGEMPVPAASASISSLVNSPRSEHSKKPEIFYEIIEKMFPDLPKIELFCREAREGWGAWGNQVNEAA